LHFTQKNTPCQDQARLSHFYVASIVIFFNQLLNYS
jgi:hypothetical protein